ncbi:MAG TPA: MOP flippase family protein [Methylocella sp.]|jgi:O-antigen/teichoic acid export membrane protein
MTTRTAAFAAIRWTSMAMIGRSAIALAQIVVLSRLLDPADFKSVAIAVTIINVGIVFTDMGLSNAVIRFRDVTSDELVSLFWLNLMLGGGVTFAVAAASPLIAWFYGDTRLTPLIQMASTVFFITAFGQQQRSLAEKNLQFKGLFGIEILSALLGFCVAVIMALFGFGAPSIVTGNIANAIGVSGLCWVMLTDGFRPKLTFRFVTAKRFMSFGLNVVVFQFFNALALNGDVILGGRLIPGSALGYYFQPRDLCLRIMFVVNTIVNRVSFPLLASVAHDKPRIKSVYLKALNMTSSVNFPIYAFLAVFSSDVIEIVMGPKWGDSISVMRVLALWCAVRSIGNPVGILLLATGETRLATVSATTVAISLFVFVGLGAQFGILGIPIALTILYVLLVPIFWATLVRPVCGAGFTEYHRVLLLPALSTVCAAAAEIVVLEFVEGAFARLSLGGAAGVVAYVGASWFLNRGWLLSMTELLMVEPVRRRLA